MVEGHVSVRACGFESRSGHKHKSRKAAITAAFLVLHLRNGPVVGPLLQRLQEIRVVSWRPKRVHSFFRLYSEPELFQDVEILEARLLKALMGRMFPNHCIPLPADSGVSNALQINGALQLLQLLSEHGCHIKELVESCCIDARSGAVIENLLSILNACSHTHELPQRPVTRQHFTRLTPAMSRAYKVFLAAAYPRATL